jgi:hypothetical protein
VFAPAGVPYPEPSPKTNSVRITVPGNFFDVPFCGKVGTAIESESKEVAASAETLGNRMIHNPIPQHKTSPTAKTPAKMPKTIQIGFLFFGAELACDISQSPFTKDKTSDE